MPSPVGHALSGILLAAVMPRLVSSWRGHDGEAGVRPEVRLTLLAAAMAVAPDLDLAVTTHRAAWHSLGAAALVGLIAWAGLRWCRASEAGLWAAVCAAAWATHVVLDWLGKDSSPPRGVMAFWPLSSAYVESGFDVFSEISRRYWNPDEFVWGNLRAVSREVAVLLPPTVLAVWWGRR